MIEHRPVLLEKSISLLGIKPGGTYADLTVGLGGHSEAVLGRLGASGRLFGFDKDGEALRIAAERLAGHDGRLTLIRKDFSGAAAALAGAGVESLDGFIMDLGVSMLQLRSAERGFSFSSDAPLDMRMDRSDGPTAATLVNELPQEELADIILRYGEERWAKAIARRIVGAREESPVLTTAGLAEIVKRAIPKRAWPPKIHPATRTFQALRIAVNDELGSLSRALVGMLRILGPGGRAVVISYHSLEDRIVKQAFRELAKGCDCPPDFPRCVCGKTPSLKVLTHRPVVPDEDEIRDNPSARSARLRAAEKI